MKYESSYGIIPLRKIGKEWSVLLIQHGADGSGHWSFPKGHPEKGESPQETAVRELQEETGLTINHLYDEEPLKESYQFLWKGTYIHKTVTYFIAEVSGTLDLQTDEIYAAKWVPLKGAEKYVTYPAAKAVCRQVVEKMSD